MDDRYLTLARESQATVREKMSKFIAFAFPADSEGQAMQCIAGVQRKYHDARHVCWAFKVGATQPLERLNDNGEPSGTAGKPILGQINSLGLTNVAVAVVRYFGGIKLGTSGLIAAYRQVTREALEQAPKAERFEAATISIHFGYAVMNEVMKVIKSTPGLDVLAQQFDIDCSMTLSVPKGSARTLENRLADIDTVAVG